MYDEEEENEGTVFTWSKPPPDPKYYFELYRDNFYEFQNKACLPKFEGNFRLKCDITTDHKQDKTSPKKAQAKNAASSSGMRPPVSKFVELAEEEEEEDISHLQLLQQRFLTARSKSASTSPTATPPSSQPQSQPQSQPLPLSPQQATEIQQSQLPLESSNQSLLTPPFSQSPRTSPPSSQSTPTGVQQRPPPQRIQQQPTSKPPPVRQPPGRQQPPPQRQSPSAQRQPPPPQRQTQPPPQRIPSQGTLPPPQRQPPQQPPPQRQPPQRGAPQPTQRLPLPPQRRPNLPPNATPPASPQPQQQQTDATPQQQTVLAKRKENPAAPQQATPQKRQKTSPATSPAGGISPKEKEKMDHQRQMNEAEAVAKNQAPNGSINLLSLDEESFIVFKTDLLHTKEKEVLGLGLLYKDGTTNFRGIKEKTVTPKKSNKDEEEESPVKPRRKLQRTLSFQQNELKNLVGVGLSWKNNIYFLPLVESTGGEQLNLPLQNRWLFIIEILESTTLEKVCYNSKQMLISLCVCNASIREVLPVSLLDPKIGGWLISPDYQKDKEAYKFDRLIETYLPDHASAIAQEATKETEELRHKFCDDLHCVNSLMQEIYTVLEREKLIPVFINQEMRLPIILANMELEGVSIETGYLTRYKEAIQSRMKLLQERAIEWAKHPFKITSPKQVATVLYDELKLARPTGKEKTNSTSKEALEAIRDKHPLPGLILEYRHLGKLLSTYVDSIVGLALPSQTNPIMSRKGKEKEEGNPSLSIIHCSWDQTKTATGRLSSSKPNMQNLPKEESYLYTREGAEQISINIRDAFCSREGTLFISADYSQLEMRILAHCANDDSLIRFFRSGNDFFKLIASRYLSKQPEEITKAEREDAKKVCYGILYGQGIKALSQKLEKPEQETKKFMDRFHAKFPKIKQFLESTKNQARRTGHVRTELDRLRLLPDINSLNTQDRASAERQAVNTKIQGTASDVVKHAMIAIDEALRKATKAKQFRAKFLLQIHDELILEVPYEEVPNVVDIVRSCMSAALPLSLPLPVTLRVGERLGSLAPISDENVKEMQSTNKLPADVEKQLDEMRQNLEKQRQLLPEPKQPIPATQPPKTMPPKKEEPQQPKSAESQPAPPQSQQPQPPPSRTTTATRVPQQPPQRPTRTQPAGGPLPQRPGQPGNPQRLPSRPPPQLPPRPLHPPMRGPPLRGPPQRSAGQAPTPQPPTQQPPQRTTPTQQPPQRPTTQPLQQPPQRVPPQQPQQPTQTLPNAESSLTTTTTTQQPPQRQSPPKVIPQQPPPQRVPPPVRAAPVPGRPGPATTPFRPQQQPPGRVQPFRPAQQPSQPPPPTRPQLPPSRLQQAPSGMTRPPITPVGRAPVAQPKVAPSLPPPVQRQVVPMRAPSLPPPSRTVLHQGIPSRQPFQPGRPMPQQPQPTQPLQRIPAPVQSQPPPPSLRQATTTTRPPQQDEDVNMDGGDSMMEDEHISFSQPDEFGGNTSFGEEENHSDIVFTDSQLPDKDEFLEEGFEAEGRAVFVEGDDHNDSFEDLNDLDLDFMEAEMQNNNNGMVP